MTNLILFVGSHQPARFLAVLEEDHRGNTTHLISDRDIGIQIHVELEENGIFAVMLGNFIQHRSHRPAGAAPGGPEVHKHGLIGLKDDILEFTFIYIADATTHTASLSQASR